MTSFQSRNHHLPERLLAGTVAALIASVGFSVLESLEDITAFVRLPSWALVFIFATLLGVTVITLSQLPSQYASTGEHLLKGIFTGSFAILIAPIIIKIPALWPITIPLVGFILGVWWSADDYLFPWLFILIGLLGFWQDRIPSMTALLALIGIIVLPFEEKRLELIILLIIISLLMILDGVILRGAIVLLLGLQQSTLQLKT